MFLLKSVVGKLWLTITTMVIVVLLILSLFLFQFIETSFPKSQDQTENLQRLALKVAGGIAMHMEDQRYIQVVGELLSAQDASIILLNSAYQEAPVSVEGVREGNLHYQDFFTKQELQEVFSGASGSVFSMVKDDYIAVAVPLVSEVNQSITGSVILYQLTQSFEETQSYVKKLFVVVGVIGFSMTTFFAFFLSSKITQPLLQLKKAADLISHGEYGTRVPIGSSDEIGELGKTFNHMGEELSDTIKALSHEKEHLSSILRSMADAVITFDADGHVILMNPQGEKIIHDWKELGWGEDASERTDADELMFVKESVPEPMRQLFEAVIQHAKEMTSKLHVQNEVWSVVMAPLYSQDVVRGVVAVLRDVTEEHRLDKLRKDFVANVSHELRTPLSMLQGYSEALLDDIAASPEERNELAQVIYDESLRMGRLVRDLLDLARMETGNIELHFRELEIVPFLKRIHRKFAALSKERGISMQHDLPEGELILEQADEDRLEQVLTNLLDNALRHTPSGAQIRISAERTKWKVEDAALIEISDQGQGIPPEDLPFIFERFYKADKARTRGASGGTGLGLAIVKNIVEAHHGAVQVKSHVGQGTTFSITLPLRLS
ncbi:ATP-binding protein [Paenibacillus sp. GD4]|uniref:ATP-binding protein n=1 Tax=Paenibacillus sp. GD4 TaxID=3068890 RepID=UPI0027968F2A|nr:ATP-binding protein [Paenibacillus sp. GD4]MDQ1909456.1 ATP-binding protein [Paenibacillus sp. GD4]